MASISPDKLDALAGRLSKAAQSIRAGTLSLQSDTTQRLELAQAASDVAEAVILPQDKILFFAARIAHIAALRLFHVWDAFTKIPSGEGASISYAALAAQLGADEALISQ